jgi:hypothetical protein
MGMFTYSRNIPNPPDNPAFDVTLMQQNSQSINDLIAVEHQGFNSATNVGGLHTKVTFAGGAQTTPTLAPTQIQTYPQLPVIPGSSPNYLENFVSTTNSAGTQTNGYLPMIKCMVSFQSLGTNGTITPTSGFAIVNVKQIGGVYQIIQSNAGKTITVNFATALLSNPYYVFQSIGSQIGGSISSVGNASNLVFNSPVAILLNLSFSFMVI